MMCCQAITIEPDDAPDQRGSAGVMVAMAGVFLIVATLVLSGLRQQVSDRSRAQAAADASALAGVAEGRSAAAALAAANGAVLVGFVDHGNEVTVEVVVGDQTVASASAERRIATFERR